MFVGMVALQKKDVAVVIRQLHQIAGMAAIVLESVARMQIAGLETPSRMSFVVEKRTAQKGTKHVGVEALHISCVA